MLASAWFGLLLIGASFASEPTKCCFDKQYTVTIGDFGELLTPANEGRFIDGYILSGFDYYRDRHGMLAVFDQPDGSVFRTYQLKDYATRRLYTKENNNTCTYADLPSFDMIHPPCIPDSATYLGSSVFGYGPHSLRVHNWKFNHRMAADKTTQMMLSVTQEHCVPVIETMVGSYLGNPIEQTLFFHRYHPGIENLNSLDIPTGCQPAPTPASG